MMPAIGFCEQEVSPPTSMLGVNSSLYDPGPATSAATNGSITAYANLWAGRRVFIGVYAPSHAREAYDFILRTNLVAQPGPGSAERAFGPAVALPSNFRFLYNVLPRFHYIFYVVSINSVSDLTIIMRKTASSLPSMIVSTTNPFPTRDLAGMGWFAESDDDGSSSLQIDILAQDPGYVVGVYYLGILATTTLDYSIAAYTDKTSTPLELGTEIQVTATTYSFSYYVVLVHNHFSRFLIRAVQLDPNLPQFMALLVHRNRKPSTSSYIFASSVADSDGAIVFDLRPAEPARYYIMVHWFKSGYTGPVMRHPYRLSCRVEPDPPPGIRFSPPALGKIGGTADVLDWPGHPAGQVPWMPESGPPPDPDQVSLMTLEEPEILTLTGAGWIARRVIVDRPASVLTVAARSPALSSTFSGKALPSLTVRVRRGLPPVPGTSDAVAHSPVPGGTAFVVEVPMPVVGADYFIEVALTTTAPNVTVGAAAGADARRLGGRTGLRLELSATLQSLPAGWGLAPIAELANYLVTSVQQAPLSYRFYYFLAPASLRDLTVQLTQDSTCRSDIIISTHDPRPTRGKMAMANSLKGWWKSESYLGNGRQVIIRDFDPGYIAPGTYYVAVYTSTSCIYYITARIDVPAPNLRLGGPPIAGSVAVTAIVDFRFVPGLASSRTYLVLKHRPPYRAGLSMFVKLCRTGGAGGVASNCVPTLQDYDAITTSPDPPGSGRYVLGFAAAAPDDLFYVAVYGQDLGLVPSGGLYDFTLELVADQAINAALVPVIPAPPTDQEQAASVAAISAAAAREATPGGVVVSSLVPDTAVNGTVLRGGWVFFRLPLAEVTRVELEQLNTFSVIGGTSVAAVEGVQLFVGAGVVPFVVENQTSLVESGNKSNSTMYNRTTVAATTAAAATKNLTKKFDLCGTIDSVSAVATGSQGPCDTLSPFSSVQGLLALVAPPNLFTAASADGVTSGPRYLYIGIFYGPPKFPGITTTAATSSSTSVRATTTARSVTTNTFRLQTTTAAANRTSSVPSTTPAPKPTPTPPPLPAQMDFVLRTSRLAKHPLPRDVPFSTLGVGGVIGASIVLTGYVTLNPSGLSQSFFRIYDSSWATSALVGGEMVAIITVRAVGGSVDLTASASQRLPGFLRGMTAGQEARSQAALGNQPVTVVTVKRTVHVGVSLAFGVSANFTLAVVIQPKSLDLAMEQILRGVLSAPLSESKFGGVGWRRSFFRIPASEHEGRRVRVRLLPADPICTNSSVANTSSASNSSNTSSANNSVAEAFPCFDPSCCFGNNPFRGFDLLLKRGAPPSQDDPADFQINISQPNAVCGAVRTCNASAPASDLPAGCLSPCRQVPPAGVCAAAAASAAATPSAEAAAAAAAADTPTQGVCCTLYRAYDAFFQSSAGATANNGDGDWYVAVQGRGLLSGRSRRRTDKFLLAVTLAGGGGRAEASASAALGKLGGDALDGACMPAAPAPVAVGPAGTAEALLVRQGQSGGMVGSGSPLGVLSPTATARCLGGETSSGEISGGLCFTDPTAILSPSSQGSRTPPVFQELTAALPLIEGEVATGQTQAFMWRRPVAPWPWTAAVVNISLWQLLGGGGGLRLSVRRGPTAMAPPPLSSAGLGGPDSADVLGRPGDPSVHGATLAVRMGPGSASTLWMWVEGFSAAGLQRVPFRLTIDDPARPCDRPKLLMSAFAPGAGGAVMTALAAGARFEWLLGPAPAGRTLVVEATAIADPSVGACRFSSGSGTDPCVLPSSPPAWNGWGFLPRNASAAAAKAAAIATGSCGGCQLLRGWEYNGLLAGSATASPMAVNRFAVLDVFREVPIRICRKDSLFGVENIHQSFTQVWSASRFPFYYALTDLTGAVPTECEDGTQPYLVAAFETIAAYNFSVSNAQECCDQCRNQPSCTHWQYVLNQSCYYCVDQDVPVEDVVTFPLGRNITYFFNTTDTWWGMFPRKVDRGPRCWLEQGSCCLLSNMTAAQADSIKDPIPGAAAAAAAAAYAASEAGRSAPGDTLWPTVGSVGLCRPVPISLSLEVRLSNCPGEGETSNSAGESGPKVSEGTSKWTADGRDISEVLDDRQRWTVRVEGAVAPWSDNLTFCLMQFGGEGCALKTLRALGLRSQAEDGSSLCAGVRKGDSSPAIHRCMLKLLAPPIPSSGLPSLLEWNATRLNGSMSLIQIRLLNGTGRLCLSAVALPSIGGARANLEACTTAGGWFRDPVWGRLRFVAASALRAWQSGEPAGWGGGIGMDGTGGCLTGVPTCPGPRRLWGDGCSTPPSPPPLYVLSCFNTSEAGPARVVLASDDPFVVDWRRQLGQTMFSVGIESHGPSLVSIRSWTEEGPPQIRSGRTYGGDLAIPSLSAATNLTAPLERHMQFRPPVGDFFARAAVTVGPLPFLSAATPQPMLLLEARQDRCAADQAPAAVSSWIPGLASQPQPSGARWMAQVRLPWLPWGRVWCVTMRVNGSAAAEAGWSAPAPTPSANATFSLSTGKSTSTSVNNTMTAASTSAAFSSMASNGTTSGGPALAGVWLGTLRFILQVVPAEG